MPISNQPVRASLGSVAAKPADAKDLAKDVAAMSLAGGVIVIGVDETAGTATAVNPFPLAGRVEQIQQVIDSRVQPPPSVTIDALPTAQGASDGVILITIMPSVSAPHMVDDRYPARSGSTTRYLSDREVDEWHDRRRRLREDPAQRPGLVDFIDPPDGAQSPPQGVGRMRVRTRPATQIVHPDEPRLRSALDEACRSAGSTLAPLVRPDYLPSSLEWLLNWAPRGGTGGAAGQAETTNLRMPFEHKLAAGTYIYRGGFSFQVVLGLVPPGVQFWVAYEHLWAAELIGLLALVGHFYADLPVASPLRCDLELLGLDRALSFFASYRHGGSGGFHDGSDVPRVTDSRYERGGAFPARLLAEDPRSAARELLDPLLVSIVPEQVDIFGRLAP